MPHICHFCQMLFMKYGDYDKLEIETFSLSFCLQIYFAWCLFYWNSILRRFEPGLSLLTQNDIFYKANTIRQNLKFISCFILSPYLPLPRVCWKLTRGRKWVKFQNTPHDIYVCKTSRIVKNSSECIWGALSANVKSSGSLTFAFIQVTSHLKHCSSRSPVTGPACCLPKGHQGNQVSV